ncbi:MAG: hypothetical protein K0Q50_2096 [Vampirovibrio sp.]|jgi:hypothetical protein|nr:hypothetical protein [Vampirovibrio sp.]
MSLELKHYIKEALGKGADREALTRTLSRSGWSDAVIQKTLDQFVGVDAFGVPIPAPRMQAHQIARDLFIYLLVLVTLGMSAFALGGLLFDLINQYLPDPASQYWGRNINWAIAQLIVAFPVFTLLTRLVQRDVDRHPEKRESLIRKLLIYFILTLTAIVGLGDLISTLTTFLQGELTLRFTAKALVVLGISLLVFVYYLFEMRRDDSLVRRDDAVQEEAA